MKNLWAPMEYNPDASITFSESIPQGATVQLTEAIREVMIEDTRNTSRQVVQALAFTNQVGELAEAQGHHPDIYLTWGKVKLTIWTHKIDGLTESDFILAAKVDEL
jgi:pterin-4a-carbinolamine dehydratase